MKNRWVLSFWVLLLISVFAPGPGSAQSRSNASETSREVGWGGFVGIGNGPAPRAVLGVHLLTPIFGPVSGRVDYSFMTSAFGSCDDSWPGSYECSMTGHSVFLGAELQSRRDSWIQPFLDAGVGGFFRSGGPSTDRTSFAPAFGGGARFSPGGVVSWKLLVRRTWMFDDGYGGLMGEDLRFSFLAWEMEIHPRR